MRKLILHIGLFLLPLFLLLLVIPVDKRQKFIGLEADCYNHGIWVHDRIFHSQTPIDIAFLGSSHTICGVDDGFLSEKMDGLEVANLGYCRLGRNLNYVLLKELVSQKEVQQIIIEVREKEDRFSHPIFPYMARSEDVMLPKLFFNQKILGDMWTHLSYKIELVQERLYAQEKVMPIRTEPFGHSTAADTADLAEMEEIKHKRSSPKEPPTSLERSVNNQFAKGYLEKMAQLCEQKGIQMRFLYLPGYGIPVGKPPLYDYYQGYGEVIIPPDSLLGNPALWYDDQHFNKGGARELSGWLGTKI